MRKQLLFRIFVALFFSLVQFFTFTASTNTVEAQSSTHNCTINFVNFNGSNQDPSTSIPINTDFSLIISCTSFTTPKNVSVTLKGVTKTINGLSAVVNTSFGVWNFPSGPSDSITIDIPGDTVTCMGNCTVNINEGVIPKPLPEVPVTNCPSSFSYNPATPQKNRPFQVLFPIPTSLPHSLNGDTAPIQYRFVYITQPGNQMGDYPLIVNNGKWVVNYPAVSVSTNWSLLETVGESTATCKDDDPFFVKTGGANPCSTGPTGTCDTALGNIPTNLKDFSTRLLSIATGIAGGIALILMVIGAIRVLMSSGDQQKLSGGRDMIVAAVTGLLFLIFSVLILKFIGINILGQVPGL